MENKKRGEVISECANMVIACWQHYADTPLKSAELLPEIAAALKDILPKKITTWDWRTAAMEREGCLSEEVDICDSHESCDDCHTKTKQLQQNIGYVEDNWRNC